ncbi:hypothetical protein WDU94_001644 [Cyamophila willieti]
MSASEIQKHLRGEIGQSIELLQEDEERDMDDEEGTNSNHSGNNWSHWIHKLPSKVKEQLIYTRAPNSDDHIFWVNIYSPTVTLAKKELSKTRQLYLKVLKSGDKNASLKMSSTNGKSSNNKNEPQYVANSSKLGDAEHSQNTAGPNNSNITESDDNDNDNEELNHGDDFESHDDISKDPELTDKIVKKLIYADGPFSDDHIFWVNCRNERVVNLRKEIRRLKQEADKCTKGGTHNWDLVEQLEEKERLFVKTYIKKINFTKNPPTLGPPPDKKMYKKKDQKCPARSKLNIVINQLDRDIKFLKRYQNRYTINMQNELKLKKRQCFEQFYVPKTPEELQELYNRKKGIQIPLKPNKDLEIPPWIDELSDDDKQRLVHTKQTFTKDHIFWTDARGVEVNQQRAIMKKTKDHLQKVLKSGNQTQIASAKETLEKQELNFISKYIHKVEIDHSLPLIHPMPKDLKKIIYNFHNQSPFKMKGCAEQQEMLLKLKDLQNKVSLMGKYKNMYTPHVLNQLHHLEFEYKKCFLIPKNPDKVFPEYEIKLVNDASKDSSGNNRLHFQSQESGEIDDSHLESDPRVEDSQRPGVDEKMYMDDEEDEDEEGINSNQTSNNNWSSWINELPSKVKEQLIYTKEPNSNDHIFWVHTPDHTVIWAKKELAKMRHDHQKASKSGDTDQIHILKKEIRDKEDLFVRKYFNKVEYDKTLPMIKPMEPRLRKALYYKKNSEVTYNINRCPKQIEMLLDLKERKRVFTRMVRIKNMHAPSVVNELYHKEFEYQKLFLTPKNEAEIQSAIERRQEMPKRLTKKQMKRMKQMAKKLEKAKASFGNNNSKNLQNPNTMKKLKQQSGIEFTRKNQDSSSFVQTNRYNESRFGTNTSNMIFEPPTSHQNSYNSYENNWRQNQPERQPANNNSQQSNTDRNDQIQIWEQPDRIWGQQMRDEQNVHGEYQPEKVQSRKNEDYYNQYYGYNSSKTNQDNHPSQPSWGQPNSNWSQAPPATKQTFDSRRSGCNARPMERYAPADDQDRRFPDPSMSRNDLHNQRGSLNQSWKNRRNLDQYSNRNYNQNTSERNYGSHNFKDNSRGSRPHGYYPY